MPKKMTTAKRKPASRKPVREGSAANLQRRRCRVMISHANVEIELAMAIRELLVNAIPALSHNDIWYSEGERALSVKKPFYDQIVARMKECKAVVSIQSPVSKARPWPLWECGIAFGLGKGPYVFTFAANQSIRGCLGTPLDHQEQYDGTIGQEVNEVVSAIADALGEELAANHRELADKFVADTVDLVAKTRVAEVVFDRRLTIIATREQFEIIKKTGVMHDEVKVIGDAHSFEAFNYDFDPKGPPQILKWSDFFANLKKEGAPWPNSSERWANAFLQVLQKAGDNRLVQDSEALPLYYSPKLKKSLRPALTKRALRGANIEFEVTFVDLPAELVARPPGDLDILFHYLDLGRMLRWGVLDSGEVVDLRLKSIIAPEELQATIKSILLKIYNIRTEFLNRGLPRESLLQTIGQHDSGEVLTLLREYYDLMGKLDPSNGKLEKIPNRTQFLSYLDELLTVNKRFLEIIIEGIDASVKRLPSYHAEGAMRSLQDLSGLHGAEGEVVSDSARRRKKPRGRAGVS